jgi:hypothetical protein
MPHLIHEANKTILSSTVLCNVTQLCALGDFSIVPDATYARGPKTRIDQKGADEIFGLPFVFLGY